LEAYWEQLQGTYWELVRTFWDLWEHVWDSLKNSSSSIHQPKRKKLGPPPKCMLRLLVPNIEGSKIVCHRFLLGLITSLTKCVHIIHAPWVKSWRKIKEQHYVLKLQIIVKSFQFACVLHATCPYDFTKATLQNNSRYQFEQSHNSLATNSFFAPRHKPT